MRVFKIPHHRTVFDKVRVEILMGENCSRNSKDDNIVDRNIVESQFIFVLLQLLSECQNICSIEGCVQGKLRHCRKGSMHRPRNYLADIWNFNIFEICIRDDRSCRSNWGSALRRGSSRCIEIRNRNFSGESCAVHAFFCISTCGVCCISACSNEIFNVFFYNSSIGAGTCNKRRIDACSFGAISSSR